MNLNFFTGTAAELIKVYPLIHSSLQRGIGVRVISSGQSRENFLMQYRDLNLPEANLTLLIDSEGDLQRASSALRWFLRAIFSGKRKLRSKLLASGDEKNFLIVHGDTLSTLAGAWLGWRLGLPVVHIEAGLRSPSLFNPFPEEITRRLVSRLATYHMAPDRRAEENLKRAHVGGKIVNTHGNTLMDAVLLSALLGGAKKPTEPFALVNIHRFENLNSTSRWSKIIDTIVKASEKTRLIFVVHPQTRHKLNQDQHSLKRLTKPQIEIRERMPFSEFISLLKTSSFLITDGGSNQEECSYLGKPCLILRESSERLEGLDSCCVLTRFEQNAIDQFLADPKRWGAPSLPAQDSPSSVILNTLLNV